MMKVINMLLFSLVLSGCSSPPPPVPVEWDKPGQSVNTGLPQWRDNSVINPSPVVKDTWLLPIHARNFNETRWTPAVFYAVAHSTRIVVAAPSSVEFFTAKKLAAPVWRKRRYCISAGLWFPDMQRHPNLFLTLNTPAL